uniref:Type IX secretion system membrane protein PorP/SprF n=1 Tax=Roseihalotalea indica TaxID=2867963 RepID=A0AA49JC86_9BACT|nr:type IX secretion system membrane protein PorP/SprF [Tunicatimonas sp. TK19036]
MKKYLLYIYFTLSFIPVLAQQQPMYTQYMFNALAINPAYAGSQGSWSATALGRLQWVGMQGAPRTKTLAVHGPVFNQKIALGLNIIHDEIGVSCQSGVFATYAYRIKLFSLANLAFGLQGGFHQYQTNFTKVLLQNSNDQHFIANESRIFLPNVGAGIFYQTQRFYAGASVPQLLTQTYLSNGDYQAKQARHYFVHAGYVFPLNEVLKIKPNFLLKMVEGAPVEVDLNANLLILEKLWVGASYRSFDALSGLIEVLPTDRLRIGYAYDYTLTDLQQVGVNTHELMVNYRFAVPKQKIVTPRYF